MVNKARLKNLFAIVSGDLAHRDPAGKREFSNLKDIDTLVITEVLNAKAIGVIAKVTATDASNSEVKYEGPEYLVFNFKALGIRCRTGSGRYPA